ncbi:MAG: hypothetical protein ABI835_17335, partial [Chloroflexota bacterium]
MTTAESYPLDLAAIYDEVADFLASAPSSEQIIAFRLSDPSEQLITDLLESSKTKELHPRSCDPEALLREALANVQDRLDLLDHVAHFVRVCK